MLLEAYYFLTINAMMLLGNWESEKRGLAGTSLSNRPIMPSRVPLLGDFLARRIREWRVLLKEHSGIGVCRNCRNAKVWGTHITL